MRDCQPFRGFALISTLKQPAQMLRDPSLACLFVCFYKALEVGRWSSLLETPLSASI